MSYTPPGTEIINNEMWLIDYSSNGCNNNPFTGCWVEAGVQASQDNAFEHFFWAEVRPGGAYFETRLPMATPGTTSNVFMTLEAAQDYSHWLISIVSPQQSFAYSITRNWGSATMFPANVNIGAELSGTVGGHSDKAYWLSNEWRDAPGNWHYQDTPGTLPQPANPPWGGWEIAPPSSTYPGGAFAAITP